jgi:hypothetical protein
MQSLSSTASSSSAALPVLNPTNGKTWPAATMRSHLIRTSKSFSNRTCAVNGARSSATRPWRP